MDLSRFFGGAKNESCEVAEGKRFDAAQGGAGAARRHMVQELLTSGQAATPSAVAAGVAEIRDQHIKASCSAPPKM